MIADTLTTADGTTLTATRNSARGIYDIHIEGVLVAHAMIPETALITMEEAVKCWDGEPGLYTYEGENPFPQYMPDMLRRFPHLAPAITATVKKRRAKKAS